MSDSFEERFKLVAKREGVLRKLREAPLEKPKLVDCVAVSRSTIDRAVRDLLEAGLIRRDEDGYRTTAIGALALQSYDRAKRTFDATFGARETLSLFEPVPEYSPQYLVDSDIFVLSQDEEIEVFQKLTDDITGAASFDCMLPFFPDTSILRSIYEAVVNNGARGRLVVRESLYRSLATNYEATMTTLRETDRFELLVGETPPFGLFVTRRGSMNVLWSTVTDDDGSQVLVRSTSENAAALGRQKVSIAAEDATDARAVTQPSDRDRKQSPGRLPYVIEREGFNDLSDSDFHAEPQGFEEACRSGFGFSEIAAGYPAERYGPEDDEPVADQAWNHLKNGQDVLLLGPPASGKSTICKKVAYEWHRTNQEPVYYRSGQDDTFDSVARFRRHLETLDEHALVVAEDIARVGARRLLELREQLVDESVTFVFDSRQTEWNPEIGSAVKSVSTAELSDLKILSMPPLNERTVDELISRFETWNNRTITANPEDVLEAIRAQDIAGGDGRTGEFLICVRMLEAWTDAGSQKAPLDSKPVNEQIWQLYDIIEEDPTVRDTAFGAIILGIVGKPVRPSYLYSITTEHSAAGVSDAIERLYGRLLFNSSLAGDDNTYRTLHEFLLWEFLSGYIDQHSKAESREQFTAVLESLIQIPVDIKTQGVIERALGGSPYALDRLGEQKTEWADELIDGLRRFSRHHPGMAPILATESGLSFEAEEACSPRAVDRLIEGLGRAYVDTSEPECGIALGERLRERGQQRQDDFALALGHQCLGHTYNELSDWETAINHSKRALELFERAESQQFELAKTNYDLTCAHRRAGNLEQSRKYCKIAREQFESIGSETNIARCLIVYGNILFREGDFKTSREYQQEALERFRKVGDRRQIAKCLNNISIADKNIGNLDSAVENLRRAMSISKSVGNTRGDMGNRINLGDIERKRGNFDQARELLTDGFELAKELGDDRSKVIAANNLGESLLESDPDRAIEWLEQALEVWADIDDKCSKANVLVNLGIAHLNISEYDDADEFLSEAISLFDSLGHETGSLAARGYRAELSWHNGEISAARDQFQESIDGISDIGDSELALSILDRWIQLEVEAGKDTKVNELLSQAQTLAEIAPDADPTDYEAPKSDLSRTDN